VSSGAITRLESRRYGRANKQRVPWSKATSAEAIVLMNDRQEQIETGTFDSGWGLGFVFFSDVNKDADVNRDTAIRFSDERGTIGRRGENHETPGEGIFET